jgi:photosystem II stability/assembly factor-like uncharacterized protein
VKIAVDSKEVNAEVRGTYFISAKSAWFTLAQSDTLRDRLGQSSGFVSTNDGGATWRSESLPEVDWFFDSLAATDDPQGAVWLGGQISQAIDAPADTMECPQRVKGLTWYPTVYFRRAPGSAWVAQRLPVQNGCPVSIISFSDKLTGIAVAGTAILFTDDGGQHWRRSEIRSSAKILPPVSVQFRGRDGWIGCANGEILHSEDRGRHWEQIVGPGVIWSKARGLSQWGKTAFTSKENGFQLGGDGELFGTHDRGETWNKVALPERIENFSCAENKCWAVSEDKVYRIDPE